MVKMDTHEEGRAPAATDAAGRRTPAPEASPAGVQTAAGATGAMKDGAVKDGAKDARSERLAAALRANLQRRKQARRSGLDDFGEAAGDREDE